MKGIQIYFGNVSDYNKLLISIENKKKKINRLIGESNNGVSLSLIIEQSVSRPTSTSRCWS